MEESDHALTVLLAARGNALKRFAFLLCGNASDAEDLLQEALVRSLGRSLGRDPERLEGYVRKVVLRLAIDGGRRRARWLSLRPVIAASEMTADRRSEDWATTVSLQAALMRLPPRQRACVVLHYHEDQPIARISHDLGCSEGTVKRHLHDARRALLDVLTERENPEVDAHAQ